MLKRHWGLLATAAVFVAGSASAQTAQQIDLDTAKVEQMQRQMQQLQDQMKQVNKELADAKKKAAEANGEIPAAFNGAYGADLKPFPTKAPSIIDKVKLTWGGYFSADAVWREHSTINDSNTLVQRHSVSVLAALRRKRVPRQRPAEPDFAPRRRPAHRDPEALGLLRDGLPGRRADREFQPEQQLDAPPAPGFLRLRQPRLGLPFPRRSGLELGHPDHRRHDAAEGKRPDHHRCGLHPRLRLHPQLAGALRAGHRALDVGRRVGRSSGRARLLPAPARSRNAWVGQRLDRELLAILPATAP